MVSKLASFFIYLTITILFYVGILFDTQKIMEDHFKELGIPYNMTYGGRYKYLTYLNMNLQLVYFNMCLFFSIYELKSEFISLEMFYPIHSSRSFFYRSLTFPFAVLVSLLFWTIYFFDSELVVPKIVEEVVPSWCNHIYHTLPVGAVLVEAYIYRHNYENWSILEPIVSVIFSSFYIIWILIIANRGGYWVYPILSTLSPFYRAFFMVSSCFLVVLTYKMGHFVNHTTWKLKTKLFFLNHANTSNN